MFNVIIASTFNRHKIDDPTSTINITVISHLLRVIASYLSYNIIVKYHFILITTPSLEKIILVHIDPIAYNLELSPRSRIHPFPCFTT